MFLPPSVCSNHLTQHTLKYLLMTKDVWWHYLTFKGLFDCVVEVDPVHPVFTWKASVCGCGAGVKCSLWANNKLIVRKEKLESWWDKQSSQTHSSRIIFTDNSGPCGQRLLANNTHTQEEERACLPCVIPHGNPFDFFTLPGKVPRGRNTLITWLYPFRKH